MINNEDQQKIFYFVFNQINNSSQYKKALKKFNFIKYTITLLFFSLGAYLFFCLAILFKDHSFNESLSFFLLYGGWIVIIGFKIFNRNIVKNFLNENLNISHEDLKTLANSITKKSFEKFIDDCEKNNIEDWFLFIENNENNTQLINKTHLKKKYIESIYEEINNG